MTEAFGSSGEKGQVRVFETVNAAYTGDEALGVWWRLLVTAESVHDPDILIADPHLGLVVSKVKSLPLDLIGGIGGSRWSLTRPCFGRTRCSLNGPNTPVKEILPSGTNPQKKHTAIF